MTQRYKEPQNRPIDFDHKLQTFMSFKDMDLDSHLIWNIAQFKSCAFIYKCYVYSKHECKTRMHRLTSYPWTLPYRRLQEVTMLRFRLVTLLTTWPQLYYRFIYFKLTEVIVRTSTKPLILKYCWQVSYIYFKFPFFQANECYNWIYTVFI